MGAADPKGARAWLKSDITVNREALQVFLTSQSDLREEMLGNAFPYVSGPLPPKLGPCLTLNLQPSPPIPTQGSDSDGGG